MFAKNIAGCFLFISQMKSTLLIKGSKIRAMLKVSMTEVTLVHISLFMFKDIVLFHFSFLF